LCDLQMGPDREKPPWIRVLSVPARRNGPPVPEVPAATGAALPRIWPARSRRRSGPGI